jgi:WD40 repeat protein
MNFVSKGKKPFHVTKENIVEGFGKKISSVHKNTAFTVCDFKTDDYVVIGDTDGSLHIYDYKTLGHLKSFKKHLGPILTIKIDEKNDIIFYSGSDSKVVAIKRVKDDWSLTG